MATPPAGTCALVTDSANVHVPGGLGVIGLRPAQATATSASAITAAPRSWRIVTMALPLAIPHVGESAVEPGLSPGFIVSGVDQFAPDVRVVAAVPRHFLLDHHSRAVHQVRVAALPRIVTMCQAAGHSLAGGFDEILTTDVRSKRRKLLMPVDDLPCLPSDCAHVGACLTSR